MFNLSFADITSTHIAGQWQVVNQFAGSPDADLPVAKAAHITFTSDSTLLLDSAVSGKWFLKIQQLMNRPYLDLQFQTVQTEALITRYSSDPDTNEDRMYLYFSNGL